MIAQDLVLFIELKCGDFLRILLSARPPINTNHSEEKGSIWIFFFLRATRSPNPKWQLLKLVESKQEKEITKACRLQNSLVFLTRRLPPLCSAFIRHTFPHSFASKSTEKKLQDASANANTIYWQRIAPGFRQETGQTGTTHLCPICERFCMLSCSLLTIALLNINITTRRTCHIPFHVLKPIKTWQLIV